MTEVRGKLHPALLALVDPGVLLLAQAQALQVFQGQRQAAGRLGLLQSLSYWRALLGQHHGQRMRQVSRRHPKPAPCCGSVTTEPASGAWLQKAQLLAVHT